MTADAVLASHFRRSPATRHTRKRCSWSACTKQNALLFCGSVAVVARLCGTVALVAGHENPNTYRPILDHRVGRARSPLRAGVGHAGPASRFESCFPRPYGRGYEPSENIWRAEDCPPYRPGIRFCRGKNAPGECAEGRPAPGVSRPFGVVLATAR